MTGYPCHSMVVVGYLTVDGSEYIARVQALRGRDVVSSVSDRWKLVLWSHNFRRFSLCRRTPSYDWNGWKSGFVIVAECKKGRRSSIACIYVLPPTGQYEAGNERRSRPEVGRSLEPIAEMTDCKKADIRSDRKPYDW